MSWDGELHGLKTVRLAVPVTTGGFMPIVTPVTADAA